jgi:ferredoxin
MKIEIDLDLCAGTALCADSAPEIFDVSADGFASVRDDAPEPIDERRARRAAANCPLRAIVIENDTQ